MNLLNTAVVFIKINKIFSVLHSGFTLIGKGILANFKMPKLFLIFVKPFVPEIPECICCKKIHVYRFSSHFAILQNYYEGSKKA